MSKKIVLTLLAICSLTAAYLFFNSRYEKDLTRQNAEGLTSHAAYIVCHGISNVRLDVPIAESANKILLGATGDTSANDLIFIDLGNARFKFSLRDPTRFRQGLRGGDEAARVFEKLLDERVFKRSLNTNGEAKCTAE